MVLLLGWPSGRGIDRQNGFSVSQRGLGARNFRGAETFSWHKFHSTFALAMFGTRSIASFLKAALANCFQLSNRKTVDENLRIDAIDTAIITNIENEVKTAINLRVEVYLQITNLRPYKWGYENYISSH